MRERKGREWGGGVSTYPTTTSACGAGRTEEAARWETGIKYLARGFRLFVPSGRREEQTGQLHRPPGMLNCITNTALHASLNEGGNQHAFFVRGWDGGGRGVGGEGRGRGGWSGEGGVEEGVGLSGVDCRETDEGN